MFMPSITYAPLLDMMAGTGPDERKIVAMGYLGLVYDGYEDRRGCLSRLFQKFGPNAPIQGTIRFERVDGAITATLTDGSSTYISAWNSNYTIRTDGIDFTRLVLNCTMECYRVASPLGDLTDLSASAAHIVDKSILEVNNDALEELKEAIAPKQGGVIQTLRRWTGAENLPVARAVVAPVARAVVAPVARIAPVAWAPVARAPVAGKSVAKRPNNTFDRFAMAARVEARAKLEGKRKSPDSAAEEKPAKKPHLALRVVSAGSKLVGMGVAAGVFATRGTLSALGSVGQFIQATAVTAATIVESVCDVIEGPAKPKAQTP